MTAQLYLVNLVDLFAFTRATYTRSTPARNSRHSSPFFSCFPCLFNRCPRSARALTWTHVNAPRDDMPRALKTNTIWRLSLPTGAWLVLDLATWLGLDCITWTWGPLFCENKLCPELNTWYVVSIKAPFLSLSVFRPRQPTFPLSSSLARAGKRRRCR